MTVGDILIVEQSAIAFQFWRNLKIGWQLANYQMMNEKPRGGKLAGG